jgi:hypothetical protein
MHGTVRVAGKGSRQIGVSRPPLEIDDLPEPEEVFKVPRLGPWEVIRFVIGPSLIALGISIGSGEWLLGPLNVGQYGFIGVGWVITLSAILQTFYNVEIARYVVATGEVPALGFGRTPPGYWLWVPLTVFLFYFAFIWGGWVRGASESLFSLITGRLPTPQDSGTIVWMATFLMIVVFLITLFGRKISRTLELVNWAVVGFILLSLILIDILIVPGRKWGEGILGLITPALPPKGSDPTLLGGLAGFTALASGLNWFVMNYYRDKGYGMGYRVGFISGLIGGRQEAILPVGKTFPEDEKNARLWGRWFRYLLLDQWVVFFCGAILGMVLPTILVSHLASLPGVEAPTRATMPTYAASVLGRFYGPVFFYWALLAGFFILFSTQLGIYESLVRNFTDAVYGTSERFRRLVHGDPRLFYYPFMLGLALLISIILRLALPTQLILISANMSNLGSIIFPFVLMYLNSKLPAPARLRWWSYLLLSLNVLFFGFFFLNFVYQQLTGAPLVRF